MSKAKGTFLHGGQVAAALAATVALALVGCGTALTSITPAGPSPVAAASFGGIVMGGQQPVAGSTLQLYVAGTTGSYGTGATTLGPAVLTTSGGNFSFPSFTCPSPSSLVYLIGTGGTPIGGTANANLAMMAALGACSSVGSSFVRMNELTTVGAVWALSPFMSAGGIVGAPASNVAGLQNAFAAVDKVVNNVTGVASGPALPVGATVPVTEINALGNILQNCVNSGGGSAGDTTDGLTNGTPCGKLFYNSTVGSSVPTDTITASLNMARNPAQNVAKLNDLQSNSPAFVPSLSVNSPPTAWTIAINYTAGGLLTNVTGVAPDMAGNVWISSGSNSTVVELSTTGAVTGSVTTGVNVPSGIAIDANGNAWIANSGNSTLGKITPALGSATDYSGGGLNVPNTIAIDGTGNIWLTNPNNVVSGFASSGTPLAANGFTGAGVSTPVGLAINPH